MKMEDILHECIERMACGESLEECLARFPKESGELEPLLRISQRLLAMKAPEARPEFKARALQVALAAVPREEVRPTPAWRPRWLPGWALAAAVFMVVVLGGGGATLAYSANSLPGEPLYWVKQQKERAQLLFTPSQTGKAKLEARFANARLKEMAALMEKGKPEAAEKALQRFQKHMEKSAAHSRGASLAKTPATETPRREETPTTQPTPKVGPSDPGQAKKELQDFLTAQPATQVGPSGPGQPSRIEPWPVRPGQAKKELQDFLEKHQIRNERQLRQALERMPPQQRARMLQIIGEVEDTYRQNIQTMGGP